MATKDIPPPPPPYQAPAMRACPGSEGRKDCKEKLEGKSVEPRCPLCTVDMMDRKTCSKCGRRTSSFLSTHGKITCNDCSTAFKKEVEMPSAPSTDAFSTPRSRCPRCNQMTLEARSFEEDVWGKPSGRYEEWWACTNRMCNYRTQTTYR